MSQIKKTSVCVSGFIRNASGKFLSVKRADDDDFLPGYWELPGGGVDHGEDIIEAVKREINEETGLNVTVSHPLTVLSYITHPSEDVDDHGVEIFFLCYPEDEAALRLSHEHSAFQWITFAELPSLYMTEFMRNHIAQLELHPFLTS